MAVEDDVNCTVAFSPGKAFSAGKAPVILRAGKGVRPRLGLLDGHETMNPDASVKACFLEREVYDSLFRLCPINVNKDLLGTPNPRVHHC